MSLKKKQKREQKINAKNINNSINKENIEFMNKIRANPLDFLPEEFGNIKLIEKHLAFLSRNKVKNNQNKTLDDSTIFDVTQIEDYMLQVIQEYAPTIDGSINIQLINYFHKSFTKDTQYSPYKIGYDIGIEYYHQGNKTSSENIISNILKNDEVSFKILNGFTPYDNCLFVGNELICYNHFVNEVNNIKYFLIFVWLKRNNKKTVISYCTTSEGTTSIFNPLNIASPMNENNTIDITITNTSAQMCLSCLIYCQLINSHPKLIYKKSMHKNRPRTITVEDIYSTINIDVSHPKIERSESDTSEPSGIKRKYHSVRAHIRTLKSGKVINIRSHFRGDKSLGTVNHTYNVE